MKSVIKIVKVSVITSLLCMILGTMLNAEVPFTWMKDIYSVMNFMYKHLSPINGMVWSEQHIVENMYRYGNPDDATIKLIKEFLYLQADRVSFRPTILKSKPASYWTPKDIGAIMREITRYRISKAEEVHKDAQLIQALEKIMQPQKEAMQKTYKDMQIQIDLTKDTVKDIAQQNKALLALIRQAQRKEPTTLEETTEKITTLEKLEEQQKFLTGTREVLDEILKKLTYESRAIERMTQTGFAELAGNFVQSLKESAPDKNQRYVSYATEQILLVLLWKIANPHEGSISKQDFVFYFNELSDIINRDNLQKWINATPYSKQDYDKFQKQFKLVKGKQKRLDVMLQHYEQMILAIRGYAVWESPIPPIITGAEVTYINPKGKLTTPFSDCVETSFRNWFNIVLYDATLGVFDIQSLVDKAKQDNEDIPLRLSDTLINFYRTHSSVITIEVIELYNAWTQVMEDLSGVDYVEPLLFEQKDRFYNVISSLPNMLKICNHLLFGNTPAFDQLRRQEQLDLMCEKLSREDFILTWDVMDENISQDKLDTKDFVTLKFSINNTISCMWELKKGHSVIPQVEAVEYPECESLVKILAAYVTTSRDLHGALPIDGYTLMGMCQTNKIFMYTDISEFIFLQPLRNSVNKINLIDILARGTLDQSVQVVLKQVIASLISDEFDDDSAKRLAKMIVRTIKDETSPFHASFKQLLNIQHQIVNGYLIENIIDEEMIGLYEVAKKKFAQLTNDISCALVIANAIIPKQLISWYDVAKQKFEKMTDNYSIAAIVRAVLAQKFDQWYEIAKQKFEQIKRDDEMYDDALSAIIHSVIENGVSDWNDIAQQKFMQLSDSEAAFIMNLMFYRDNKLDSSWYDTAKERFKHMTDHTALLNVIDWVLGALDAKLNPSWYDIAKDKFLFAKEVDLRMVTYDDVEKKEYPMANVIMRVIKHTFASDEEAGFWNMIAQRKFEAMQNRESIIEIISFIIKEKVDTWYDIALQKARSIKANDYVSELQKLIKKLKI